MTLIYQREVTPIENIALYLDKSVALIRHKIESSLKDNKKILTIGDLENIHVILNEKEKEVYGITEDLAPVHKYNRSNTFKGLEPQLGVMEGLSTMYRITYQDKIYTTYSLAKLLKIKQPTVIRQLKPYSKLLINGKIAEIKIVKRAQSIPYTYYQDKMYKNLTCLELSKLTGEHIRKFNGLYQGKVKIIRGAILCPETIDLCFEQVKVIAIKEGVRYYFSTLTSAIREFDLNKMLVQKVVNRDGLYNRDGLLIRWGKEC